MSVRVWWLIFLFLTLAGALPSAWCAGARAQSGMEPAGYREAIDSALEEMQLGNFVEAREQFGRAHALYPNARTLRGIGISEFELKHYAVAVDQLVAALLSDEKPLEGRLRSDTEALLARARGYVGELHVRVSPKKATMSVDGIARHGPVDAPLRLDVGDHVLEMRAEGHAVERRRVTVHGGQTERLDVELSPLVAGSNKAAPNSMGQADQAAHVDATPIYKRWWLWTVVGVVVAGAAVGTVIALKAKDDSTTYEAIPSTNTPKGVGLQPLLVH